MCGGQVAIQIHELAQRVEHFLFHFEIVRERRLVVQRRLEMSERIRVGGRDGVFPRVAPCPRGAARAVVRGASEEPSEQSHVPPFVFPFPTASALLSHLTERDISRDYG